MVLGTELGKPGTLIEQAGANLGATLARPVAPEVPAPTRIRVDSAALAESLRRAHPMLEIVCAPTPELVPVAESLAEHFASPALDTAGWLNPSVDRAAVARFLDAAREFWDAAPWQTIPDDATLIGVDIEAHGISGAVASVVGQLGESFGFLLFEDEADYEAWLVMSDAIQSGARVDVPDHIGLIYNDASGYSVDALGAI